MTSTTSAITTTTSVTSTPTPNEVTRVGDGVTRVEVELTVVGVVLVCGIQYQTAPAVFFFVRLSRAGHRIIIQRNRAVLNKSGS